VQFKSGLPRSVAMLEWLRGAFKARMRKRVGSSPTGNTFFGLFEHIFDMHSVLGSE
jgi:hypothetical protein